MCINRFLPVYVYQIVLTGMCINRFLPVYVYQIVLTGINQFPFPYKETHVYIWIPQRYALTLQGLVWIYREDGINGLRFIA